MGVMPSTSTALYQAEAVHRSTVLFGLGTGSIVDRNVETPHGNEKTSLSPQAH